MPATRAPAQAQWAVPDAPLCFEMSVKDAPSDKEAGMLAILPDGGLLPRPFPQPVVMDSSGHELRSEIVWHNPREGLGVLYEPPAAGQTASVYVKSAPRLAPAPELSAFKAGLFLYVQHGATDLGGAKRMARESPPGKGARFGTVPRIGQRMNVLARDNEYTSYYTGWFRMPKAGSAYLCTISTAGSELWVDGKSLASCPGVKGREGRKGEYGKEIELSAGLHRVDYFHFCPAGSNPEATLCWRIPGISGPQNLPLLVTPDHFTHSGRAQIARAASRNAPFPALFEWKPVRYAWLKDQPMVLYRFSTPLGAKAPAGTTWTWELGPGQTIEKPEFYWIFDGSGEHAVTVRTGGPAGGSRATLPVFLVNPPERDNPNDAWNRRTFREALLTRCQAVAPPARPCASWTPDMWSLLLLSLDPYAGKNLLYEIFERSRKDVVALPKADRWALEDYFFEVLRYTERAKGGEWLDRLEREEIDAARHFYWKATRVEFALYDLNQPEAARKLAALLPASASSPSDAAQALVCQGDVERDAGNVAEAARLYASAQERAQRVRQAPAAAPAPAQGVAPGTPPSSAPKTSGDWRNQAVRAAAYYETVHHLIGQKALFEARKAMRDWEREFPLHKLTGDYPLVEGEYFLAIGNYTRAQRVLSGYRKSVDVSNLLPDAMRMEMRCLHALGKKKEMEELLADAKKRFPTHPVVQEAQDALARMTEKPVAAVPLNEQEPWLK